MFKTTLLAAAALAVVAFGATAADAKGGYDRDGNRGHGGYHGKHGNHGGKHAGRHSGRGDYHRGGHGHHNYHKRNKYNKYNNFRLHYSWYSSNCHYEPERVRIKVWDRGGHPYFKWVKRDVKVCY